MTTTNAPKPWDLCVVGAGCGFAAAMRAHDLGKRVLILEKDRVGGAGIHCGALSSKTMWHLSNDYATAARTDRGFKATALEVSYQSVMASVQTAVTERQALLERQLKRLDEPSVKGQVRLQRGTARFISPHAVEVTSSGGQKELVEADNFLIATGSKPRIPDNIVVDGEHVVTSDQIEQFPNFPESLVVVGAGVVGCEYATVFGNFGKTRINIIDRQPRILPFEDDDVAGIVSDNFQAMGVNIHHGAKLESLAVKDRFPRRPGLRTDLGVALRGAPLIREGSTADRPAG